MLKLFSFPERWTRRPLENPGVRIERALLDRSRRLIAGLSVDDRFENVTGTLVVAKGRGKFNRILFCDSYQQPLPDALRKNCRSLSQCSKPDCTELQNCTSELALIQANVVEHLKLKAAKYVDRILAISVVDPGLWLTDFDGAISYASFCNANRLAEQTGVSVIDAYPARDLAVGGKGYPLEPLALWLLQADRNSTIARHNNCAIEIQQRTTGYLYAPSDGLDASLPIPITIDTYGMDLVDRLMKTVLQQELSSSEIRKLMVVGTHAQELLLHWQSADSMDEIVSATHAWFQQTGSAEQLFATVMKWIVLQCEQQICDGLKRFESDYDRERVKIVADLTASQRNSKSAARVLNEHAKSKPAFDRPGRILVGGVEQIADVLVSHLQNRFQKTDVSVSLGGAQEIASPSTARMLNQPSLVAALLGLLHIDQMPANIPALTGADQQRILGRLTPGRPNQWRNLLREMADFEPPAMKLRDAV